ncbi:MAG: hypothetical protein PHT07_24020 [Paludibacter sp.]|nr:hypothetical protein [Paludibacter sp.]
MNKTLGEITRDKEITLAVINFAYFTANFPPNFIEKCWEDQPEYMIKHIKAKLKSSSGCIYIQDFIKFFFDLDRGNQVKLVEWIDKNYKGITR